MGDPKSHFKKSAASFDQNKIDLFYRLYFSIFFLIVSNSLGIRETVTSKSVMPRVIQCLIL